MSCARPRCGKLDGQLYRWLPAFEGAGVKVALKFARDESIDGNMRRRRDEVLDPLARELVELQTELRGILDTKRDSDGVEHLDHGVYVRYGREAFDNDSLQDTPATITREKSRSCVYHALGALQDGFRVAITGQQGIARTRGSMIYEI